MNTLETAQRFVYLTILDVYLILPHRAELWYKRIDTLVYKNQNLDSLVLSTDSVY